MSQYRHGMLTLNPMLKHRRTEVGISWLPPEQGWVCLNTDGASRDNMNTAACGGVIRDCDGRWLCGFSRYIEVLVSAYIAKLWGSLDGLALACEKGFNKVELRMDSQIIVACLQGSHVGSVHVCVRLSNRFEGSWIWIGRSGCLDPSRVLRGK